MRIPKMPKSNQYRVSVPALNGGVNLNDAPNLVEDNQLTAVLNMWWKDQALRTRAGLVTTPWSVRSIFRRPALAIPFLARCIRR